MKQMPNINNAGLTDILVPSFDHKELEDDDCGLPENPIFANYSKYLWQGRSENPRMQSLVRVKGNTDGHNRSK
jgi:hypothetical protein